MVTISRIWKLYLVYTIVLVAGMTLAGFVLEDRLKKKLFEHLQENVLTLAQVLGKAMPDRGEEAKLSAFCKTYRTIAGMRITVMGAEGRVLADSDEAGIIGESRLDRPEIQAAIQEGTGYAARFSDTLRVDMLYGALFLGDKGSIIRLAMPMSRAKAFQNEVMLLFSLALFLAPVMAMVVSYLVARYKIGQGDWHATGAWPRPR
jgi:two-component system, OmpR family, phosphate regulon sensor histidine kinase PhoR